MAIIGYTDNGVPLHGPPYTKEEERDFYRRQTPKTIFRGVTRSSSSGNEAKRGPAEAPSNNKLRHR